ncbi:FHA domain [Trypanosoma vivax]|nr:FHA domain [Trypanosoma vivax]
MELAVVGAHNLKSLAEAGGISAVESSSFDNRSALCGQLPSHAHHEPVEGHEQCCLVVRYSCEGEFVSAHPNGRDRLAEEGRLCRNCLGSTEHRMGQVEDDDNVELDSTLLLPLGSDREKNTGVITFGSAALGPLVSRQHCVLLVTRCRPPLAREGQSGALPGLWCALRVRDCNSKNGTFVNGIRLASGAMSSPVAFNLFDEKVSYEPLLTLEFGAGAKLAAGQPMSASRLQLRFRVFVRCLVQPEYFYWMLDFMHSRVADKADTDSGCVACSEHGRDALEVCASAAIKGGSGGDVIPAANGDGSECTSVLRRSATPLREDSSDRSAVSLSPLIVKRRTVGHRVGLCGRNTSPSVNGQLAAGKPLFGKVLGAGRKWSGRHQLEAEGDEACPSLDPHAAGCLSLVSSQENNADPLPRREAICPGYEGVMHNWDGAPRCAAPPPLPCGDASTAPGKKRGRSPVPAGSFKELMMDLIGCVPQRNCGRGYAAGGGAAKANQK